MKLYIGIDLGTSAMKLLLMDGAGNIRMCSLPAAGWCGWPPL